MSTSMSMSSLDVELDIWTISQGGRQVGFGNTEMEVENIWARNLQTFSRNLKTQGIVIILEFNHQNRVN